MKRKPCSFAPSGKILLFYKLLFCLFITFNPAKAADYFWVNGAGNWSDYSNHWANSSGGAIFHTNLPSINDNVYFDGNSFSADSQMVVLDSTFAYCNNMDWSGVNYKVRFMANGWPTTNINIYGSLILDDDIYLFYCSLRFWGTSPSMTINTADVYITGNIFFEGTGTWNLAAAISSWGIIINNGTFNSNDNDFNVIGFDASSNNNPVVNLGTSILYGQTSITFGSNNNVNSSNARLVMIPYSGWVNPTVSGDNINFKTIEFQSDNGILRGNVTADSIHFMLNGGIREFQTGSNFINCNYLAFDSNASLETGNNPISNIGHGVFSGQTTFDGNVIFDTLVLNNNGYDIVNNGSITIIDSLYFNGNCAVYTNLTGGSITKSSGIVELDFVRLNNVDATGGALFIANNSFDLGNNTGWQFNSPVSRNLYRVNGGGNWSDSNFWSLTSGGPGGECPPSQVDNVFFDAQSFTTLNDTVIIEYPEIQVNNLTFQGVTESPFFYRSGYFTLNIFGSILSDSYANISGIIKLVSPNLGNTIQTGPMPVRMEIKGAGSWTLTDHLTAAIIYFHYGNFYTNNFNLNNSSIFAYSNNNARIIDLGFSTFYNTAVNFNFINSTNVISENVDVVFDLGVVGGLALNKNTFHNILFQDEGAITGSFNCNYLDFETNYQVTSDSVTVQKMELGGNGTLQGIFSIDSLIQNLQGAEMLFGENTQLNIGSTFEASGIACDQRTVLRGDSTININKIAGSINLDFVFLENISATGGAAFNATNAIDAGGNLGWNITTPLSRNLFWVGAAGNWSDPNKWSLSSGGAGGNCIPNLYDNVYFDDNSFSPATVTEYINFDVPQSYMNDLNFITTYNNTWILKRFQSIPGTSILVKGSLNFSGATAFSSSSNVEKIKMTLAASDAGNIIMTQGSDLNDVDIHFTAQGAYTLTDSLSCNVLLFNSGNLVTNGNPIKCKSLRVTSPVVSIDFLNSTLYCDTLNCQLAGAGFISQNLSVKFNDDLNGYNYMYSNNQEFKSIISGKMMRCNGGFTAEYALFNHNLIYNPNLSNQTLNIGTCDFRKNVTTYNANGLISVDTLILNNDGYMMQIMDGSTIRINNELVVNNSASFPIEIKSWPGNNFFLEKPSGLICMDNMIMQGVHVIGSGVYYAGSNTVDLGNNVGWTYASCNPANSDVWPGDANYDLVVDNFDVLYVGLAYNNTGPIRNAATNNWIAQPASDWLLQFANGANLKNSDCDGNGIVTATDTTAISLNYGLSHPPRLTPPVASSLPPVDLYVVANPDTVMEGDTVLIDIFLGTTSIPVDSIYGIAFTLSFDSTLIDTSYISFDYSGSWMGSQGTNMLTFEKKFLAQGYVDVAITRFDHINASGSGLIATTGVVVIDNIGARLSVAPPYVPLPVTISNPRALTASEFYLAITTQNSVVEIDTLGSTAIPEIELENSSLSIYPVPASDKITIRSEIETITYIEVINRLGIPVIAFSGNFKMHTIDIQSLPAGIYSLKAHAESGLFSKKFMVVKK